MNILKSKKMVFFCFAIIGGCLVATFQNAVENTANIDCGPNANISPIGMENFPKLYFSKESLGRAVACARPDLREELVTSAKKIYSNLRLERGAVTQIDFRDDDGDHFVDEFLTLATGNDVRTDGTYTQYSPQVNFKFPGDARVVQRLSAAAFFDVANAQKYREVARLTLLHWARNTFKEDSDVQAKSKAELDANFGLSIGSSMTSFAFGYDLLVAGKGMTSADERRVVEDWFGRVVRHIETSNNAWMQACVDGTPFNYDGKSCSRAMGDNHVTVATAAIYALSIMTGDQTRAQSAVQNPTPYKWGYQDRLGSIIYNLRDTVAPQDRFPFVHTGEIYDRWRGHYVERDRALQLHRSMSYPYLSLSFLTAQALMAKRQGVVDLLQPVRKANGNSISLAKAFLFYGIFLKAYDPGEIINPLAPKAGVSSDYFPGIQSTLNYTSLEQTYCLNGRFKNGGAPLLDNNCQVSSIVTNGVALVNPNTNKAFTEGYYHLTFAAAHYLLKDKDVNSQAAIAGTITEAKMQKAANAYSPHIMPFEPALFIERKVSQGFKN